MSPLNEDCFKGRSKDIVIIPVPKVFRLNEDTITTWGSDETLADWGDKSSITKLIKQSLGCIVHFEFYKLFLDHRELDDICELLELGATLKPIETRQQLGEVFLGTVPVEKPNMQYTIRDTYDDNTGLKLSLGLSHSLGALLELPILAMCDFMCPTKGFDCLLTDKQRFVVEKLPIVPSESKVYPIPHSFTIVGDSIQYEAGDRGECPNSELFAGAVVELKMRDTNVLESYFLTLESNQIDDGLLGDLGLLGVWATSPTKLSSLVSLLRLPPQTFRGMENNVRIQVEVTKDSTGLESLLIRDEVSQDSIASVKLHALQEDLVYYRDKEHTELTEVLRVESRNTKSLTISQESESTTPVLPSLASLSELALVALKYENKVVGYRFLAGTEKYDIDLQCASSLGISGFKVEKQVRLSSVGGLLVSNSETSRGSLVRDISSQTEFVAKLFDKLLSR